MRISALPWLAACLVLPPAVSALEEDPAPRSGSVRSEPREAGKLPYRLGTPYRYVWIRGSDPVGETRFSFHGVSEDSVEAYEIRSRRTYDHQKTSHRSRSTTRVRADGRPIRYEESLDVSAVQELRGHQDTRITFEETTARIQYVQNGRGDTAVVRTVNVPRGAFLFAGQAVDHWAVFSSTIPAGAESHSVDLLYPDFNKVFRVSFRREGTETLSSQGRKAEATRYDFRAEGGQLEGSVWLDADRRLLQVEFPNPSETSKALRVTLDLRSLEPDRVPPEGGNPAAEPSSRER